ncbi:hypothetical protein EYR40_005426 [Pleurotus pulmonarius]|nr:hypothetical protein EYR40_005426 [Pleurotus pulmonarius]
MLPSRSILVAVLAFTTALVQAQLTGPDPPYLPPPILDGTIQTTVTNETNPQWSRLLGNLLWFYEAQRSGQISTVYPGSRVDWRNDSTLDDGIDVQLDLSGGYYDAGDYLKATFPLSFTLMSVCWGGLDYGRGYDMANQTAYLDGMLRWGLDWLIKAHPHDNTLFVQIADSKKDNNYWGDDQGIPRPRPSFQINATHPGTDAAASASAAFSACAALYANHSFQAPYSSPASLANATYASILLSHATSLYSFAQNATGGKMTYQSSVPVVADAYKSSSYNDDLVLAALWLSWAASANYTGSNITTPRTYNASALFTEASTMYRTFALTENLGGKEGDKVFNWDEKTPGLPVLFTQIGLTDHIPGSNNVGPWRSEAEKYFDRLVTGQGTSDFTPGGLMWWDGDSDSASLNPAMNAAMLLARYAPIASTTEKTHSYLTTAQTQIDYVLGKNPMSVPYVVGMNPNSPLNPHSAPASGGTSVEKIDTDPPLGQSENILFGAVVGGPTYQDLFHDIRSDWPQTEVALDYNAPLLTLSAMSVSNALASVAGGENVDPYFTRLKGGEYERVKPTGKPCDAVFPCDSEKTGLGRSGTIAIAVVLSSVGFIILGLLAWYVRTVRNRTTATA